MKVKEEWKRWLKTQHSKMKIMASTPITSWQIGGKTMETMTDFQFSSVTRSCLTLQSHELQHARLPCPSPTPGVHPNSCPSSWWCHPAISSSVIPFSSSLQTFPASGSFQMNQFFTSDGQSIGVSALASVLPVNTEDWSPLGWTGWISLRVFSKTTVESISSSVLSFLYVPTLTSILDYWKNHSFH